MFNKTSYKKKNLKKFSFLVYGLGSTGSSVINYFKKKNISKYVAWDDNVNLRKKFSKKVTRNLKTSMKDVNFIVLSPGISLKKTKYKKDHFKILKNLVDHFKYSKIKSFLQIGSSAEYGGKKSPQFETAKCKPKSPYGRDKLNCTNYLIKAYKLFGFPSVIFRVYQAYGPMQDTNRLIPIVAKACYFNKKFDCSEGSQIRDFIYIDDIITSIIKALKTKKTNGQIFNIGSGKKVSIK